MEDKIKQLWQRAVTERAKNLPQPSFTKEEKIRLKHELEIIEQTKTADLILSFINQTDEARKKGGFCVEGAANCSFLLYSVGATTINPLWIGSQFERFINPLRDMEPYYGITFANPPVLTDEEKDTEINELILKKAITYGIIKEEQLKFDNSHPPASAYQFVEEVLSESNGNIIWQEQVIELLSRMGGFTYAEADLMRCVSMGNGKWLSQRKEEFMKHAVQIGYSREYAAQYLYYLFKANLTAQIKAHVAATVLWQSR